MEILTYREIASKDGLIPLLDQAFNWVFNQYQFDGFVKIDPRLKNGPVSFIGVEEGKIVGHVGVMDLATRTLKGDIEYVGGIYGVATLPGYTRRAVCTALMERAHAYFRERHYRFSLLSTSPVIVAHSLYEKLGYVDLFELTSAYKPTRRLKVRSSRKKKKAKFDLERIVNIYDSFVKGKTGFVIRDKAFFRMLMKVEGLKPRNFVILNEGYALLSEDKTRTWIRELVALNKTEICRLIKLTEDRAKGPVCDRMVLDQLILETYIEYGYLVQRRSNSVIMCKPLVSHASFSATYGSKFYMSRLDVF